MSYQQFPLWLFCHSVGISFCLSFSKNLPYYEHMHTEMLKKRFLLNDKKAKAEIAGILGYFFIFNLKSMSYTLLPITNYSLPISSSSQYSTALRVCGMQIEPPTKLAMAKTSKSSSFETPNS